MPITLHLQIKNNDDSLCQQQIKSKINKGTEEPLLDIVFSNKKT